MVVPPAEAPCEPAPRSTTPDFRLIVADTLKVPAASMTTWPAAHPSMAAWMSPPGETVAQVVVRTGSPSLPSGWPVGASERMPGFHSVTREGSTSDAGGPHASPQLPASLPPDEETPLDEPPLDEPAPEEPPEE